MSGGLGTERVSVGTGFLIGISSITWSGVSAGSLYLPPHAL
jgi:hypothetical protein